ncbi:hypothetical protein N7447_006094 [Penicillium robsamsonii]|uniref:uncharacterized protein n=1 Tax=Penicillium robsamsonii TaxID=1792511 RepID=UPI00254895DC|nr:uncharacterized protein N7447_006094 [Penicillium robsamsonii]KAJ5823754.1 hypothetical protein N7447_006094 [Penicillium robsamsonii]
MATTGLPTTIRPDAFPDFFNMGCWSGTRHDLARREFLTHCPPPSPRDIAYDMQPKSEAYSFKTTYSGSVTRQLENRDALE